MISISSMIRKLASAIPSYNCDSCGNILGRDGAFMLNNVLWERICENPTKDILCWKCMEERFKKAFGRPPIADDFSEYDHTPFNIGNPKLRELNNRPASKEDEMVIPVELYEDELHVPFNWKLSIGSVRATALESHLHPPDSRFKTLWEAAEKALEFIGEIEKESNNVIVRVRLRYKMLPGDGKKILEEMKSGRIK